MKAYAGNTFAISNAPLFPAEWYTACTGKAGHAISKARVQRT